MKSFSIIIPYHNTPAHDRTVYMNELLASIPDRADLEVIMVDDHSSIPFSPNAAFKHTTLRIEMNDPGLKYAGTARNKGISLANGDYLIFADSDDLFDPIELTRAMDGACESHADLILFHVSSFRDDGCRGTRHANVERMLTDFCKTGNPDSLVNYHGPWGKIISRRFVMERGLTFGATRVANDVLFAVKLFMEKPSIQVLENTAYKIREGNPSLTNDISEDTANIRINVARDVHDVLSSYGRKDLAAPLHYVLRRYARRFPRVALCQLMKSVIRGDLILPTPQRVIKHMRNLARESLARTP